MPCLRIEQSLSRKSIDVRNLALSLMADHGLAWLFALNANVRRAGVCFYPTPTKPGRIELSVHFIDRNSDEDILDTILHEIAHALVGAKHGHDETWKAKCLEIGAKPERCYGEEIDMPKGRWSSECPSCRKMFYRHRRPKNARWFCKACGSESGGLLWSTHPD